MSDPLAVLEDALRHADFHYPEAMAALASLKREREEREVALGAIAKNAESWHGVPGQGGHERALAVIAGWARDPSTQAAVAKAECTVERLGDLNPHSLDAQRLNGLEHAESVIALASRLAAETARADAAEEALRMARPVVERYGRVWAKDTDYYAAAEALGIQEPTSC